MSNNLDTVAILTGASRGLGAALARALLARPGMRLISVARRADPGLDAQALSHGTAVRQIQADLSDPASVQRTADEIFGSLPEGASRYLLINNAGTLDPVARADQLDDGAAIAAAFKLNVAAIAAPSSSWSARATGSSVPALLMSK